MPGCEDRLAPLMGALEAASALGPADVPPLLEALAAAGQRPANDTNKVVYSTPTRGVGEAS